MCDRAIDGVHESSVFPRIIDNGGITIADALHAAHAYGAPLDRKFGGGIVELRGQL
jgi:hypothetical protein